LPGRAIGASEAAGDAVFTFSVDIRRIVYDLIYNGPFEMNPSAVKIVNQSSMGARRGSELLERLHTNPPNIWFAGKQIPDPADYPGFRNGVKSLAALYDLQWQHPDAMLYDEPESGLKAGRTFLIPRTKDELKSVGRAMKLRADSNFGMMGRMPDYLNRAMTGYASGAAFLGEDDPRFGENALNYYRYLRDNDLSMTHTLIAPQANRAVGVGQQSDPYLAARIKEETSTGIVIRGCRLLATLPLSEEIMVFPSTLLKAVDEDVPYAYGFSIPTNTKGLKFLVRESFDYGGSHYDHPLSSRFEEMDAVVVFDDVFVPWDRVFLYRNVQRCNAAYGRTGALVSMAHQVAAKNLAKTEFLMGLTSLLANSIGIEGFQHIQEKLAEVWINMEAVRAFLRVAEEDAAVDEYGMMRPAWDPLDACRNLYPKLYPRMIEILQQMGASGLVAMPSAADVNGPMAEDIRRYFQGARVEAHDRIPLFRLAWDTCLSAFAGRQTLYERFFFGDPVRMAGALVQSHDRTKYMDRVRDFLEESKRGMF
jgi:4-hydroxyphenylacetate 3-monooxygenase